MDAVGSAILELSSCSFYACRLAGHTCMHSGRRMSTLGLVVILPQHAPSFIRRRVLVGKRGNPTGARFPLGKSQNIPDATTLHLPPISPAAADLKWLQFRRLLRSWRQQSKCPQMKAARHPARRARTPARMAQNGPVTAELYDSIGI